MAIVGRRPCPWCGFEHAHVRRNEGKQPYVYCPECGLGTQAKNGAQAALLTKGMKLEPKGGHAELLPPPGAGDIVTRPAGLDELPPAPAKPAAAPPPMKRRSWLSTLLDEQEKK